MDDDARLLQRWRDGDDAAGQTLFRQHFTSVHRFFSYKVGDDADELAQATFLGAVESRDRITSSFRGYLFGVARKQLLRYFEGRGRGLTADALSVRSVVDLSPTPSRVVVDNQELASLVTAMQHIPVDCQVALELYYWEEMTTAEIGEALGIPPGTVKSRLFRARSLLGSHITAAENDPIDEGRLRRFSKGATEPR